MSAAPATTRTPSLHPARTDARPGSRRPLVRGRTGPGALLEQARRGLVEAEYAARPAERYALAHLAALRGAAAVLAARAVPRRRSRPTSAWTLLARVAPELAEWAAFFAAGSARRVAAEAGVPAAVSTREADDLVRQTATFLVLARRAAGER